MYDIMKTSFCGYFAYARYLIDSTLITSQNLLPPNVNSKFAISPAHSTASFIEAWLSLAHIVGVDEDTKFIADIASQLMAQDIKAPLFANYVGNIIDNTTEIGHHELAKLHRAKCTVRDLLIDIFMEFGSTIVTHKLTSTVSPLTSNMVISNNEGSSNDTNTPVGYDD